MIDYFSKYFNIISVKIWNHFTGEVLWLFVYGCILLSLCLNNLTTMHFISFWCNNMQPLSGLRAQLLKICSKFWTHNYITAAHIFLLIHHYGRITHFFRVRLIKKMSQRMITVLLQNLNFPYCIFFGLLVARGLGGSVAWEHLSWALIAFRGVAYGKRSVKQFLIS